MLRPWRGARGMPGAVIWRGGRGWSWMAWRVRCIRPNSAREPVTKQIRRLGGIGEHVPVKDRAGGDGAGGAAAEGLMEHGGGDAGAGALDEQIVVGKGLAGGEG